MKWASGKQYEAEKQRQGGDHGNQYTVKVASGQNVRLPKSRKEIKDGTAGRIGKEYGVDGRTIRRDADFAKGVDFVECTHTAIIMALSNRRKSAVHIGKCHSKKLLAALSKFTSC